MWRLLRDQELIAVYQKQFPGGNAPEALVDLLKYMAHEEYAKEVYAATSLGNLRFTTAPEFSVEEGYDFVGVREYEGQFVVSYFEAGERRASLSRNCEKEELQGVVELYLLRLLS